MITYMGFIGPFIIKSIIIIAIISLAAFIVGKLSYSEPEDNEELAEE